MSAEQAAAWYKKQLTASVLSGEPIDVGLERIDAEFKTKTFAHIEDKPAFSGLDRLKAMQTLRKIQPSWKEEAAVKPVQETVNPFTRPAEPRTPIVLVPVEPARYQYRILVRPACNPETGMLEDVRFVVE